MPQILGTEMQKIPTSLAGAKQFGARAVGVATTGLVIVAGLGLLGLALPYIRKVPVLGMVVGGSTGAKGLVDAFGRLA